MADIKNSEAPLSTTTIDKNKVDAPTNNIYEAISIISKRANQINGDIKKELLEKLDEFATYNDSLEEIFENKEQIEVSKFYEKLPKPHSLAVQGRQVRLHHRPEHPARWRRLPGHDVSAHTRSLQRMPSGLEPEGETRRSDREQA